MWHSRRCSPACRSFASTMRHPFAAAAGHSAGYSACLRHGDSASNHGNSDYSFGTKAFDFPLRESAFSEDCRRIGTELGCSATRRGTNPGNRRRHHLHGLALRIFVRPYPSTFPNEGIFKCRFDIGDRRRGHRAGKTFEPFGRPAGREHFIQPLIHGGAIGKAVFEAGKARIDRPFGMAEPLAKNRPELFLVAHDKDVAVARAIELARHKRGMGGVWLPAVLTTRTL